MKQQVFQYWLFALFFSVGFGELFLSGIVDGNPTPFQHFVPITIYYAALSLIFALLVPRYSRLTLIIIFFTYGVLAEMFIFKNIAALSDVLGIIFFGGLYIVLFGVPLLMQNLIFRKKMVKSES